MLIIELIALFCVYHVTLVNAFEVGGWVYWRVFHPARDLWEIKDPFPLLRLVLVVLGVLVLITQLTRIIKDLQHLW